MRLFLGTLAVALLLGGTALAAPPGPDPPAATSDTSAAQTDLRAPAQQDLRAPDQQAPTRTTELRAPVQQDLRAPDQQAPTPATPSAPVSADGPAAIVFVLIGVGAALVLLVGLYFGARWRHRLADADDLVVTH